MAQSGVLWTPELVGAVCGVVGVVSLYMGFRYGSKLNQKGKFDVSYGGYLSGRVC